MNATVLGVIADDVTGATDIANTLVVAGMPTVLTLGVPPAEAIYGEARALVVALKVRSIVARDAVAIVRTALHALQARGARRTFFKYCSTFDSTDAGNIGPISDALCDALGVRLAIHCPAFPAAGRRLFGGYLFVGDGLLSESGMKDHPLTPMRDPNLVRVLQRQTAHRVARVDLDVVRSGPDAIVAELRRLVEAGARHAIVDAVADADLRTLGAAASAFEDAVMCGSSGLALGLPAAIGCDDGGVAAFPSVAGRAAVLAGSCSPATRAQVAHVRNTFAVFDLNDGTLDDPPGRIAEALAWADAQQSDVPMVIAASATPDRVAQNQRAYGAGEASARVERILAGIAAGLRARGVTRFVVAGGETSGAVVEEFHVDALRIGPQIDPGVPWTATFEPRPIALALKSGNFGTEDFFARALASTP